MELTRTPGPEEPIPIVWELSCLRVPSSDSLFSSDSRFRSVLGDGSTKYDAVRFLTVLSFTDGQVAVSSRIGNLQLLSNSQVLTGGIEDGRARAVLDQQFHGFVTGLSHVLLSWAQGIGGATRNWFALCYAVQQLVRQLPPRAVIRHTRLPAAVNELHAILAMAAVRVRQGLDVHRIKPERTHYPPTALETNLRYIQSLASGD